jgi:hypothetical protein
MDMRIAVHLARAGLKDARLDPFCQPQAVDGTHDGRLGRLDGVELVVRRRGGAGQIVNLIHLELEGIDDVVPYQLESGVIQEVRNVGLPSGEEIIEANDFMPLRQQPIAEMGTQKPGAAGDQDTHGRGNLPGPPVHFQQKSARVEKKTPRPGGAAVERAELDPPALLWST